MSSYVFLLRKQQSIGFEFTIFDIKHYAVVVVEFLNNVTFAIPSQCYVKQMKMLKINSLLNLEFFSLLFLCSSITGLQLKVELFGYPWVILR